MARTKEFDPHVALDTAMRMFWRDGYERTSTTDLTAQLGIARASLYDTFRSKRALYLAALDRYLDGSTGPTPDQVVAASDSGLAAIRALLVASAEPPDQGRPPGCFSVNATVEHGDRDPEIAARLERNRSRLEEALKLALQRARSANEIRADVDPGTTAATLAAIVSGLNVLSRAGADQRARVKRTIDGALALLAP